MGETIRVDRGSDWCNVQISRHCDGRSGATDECWLLGDGIRICTRCVQEMHGSDSPEDFVWTLKEVGHGEPCLEVSLQVGSEEVIVCPGCLRRVLLEDDPKAFDWVLRIHDYARHSEPDDSGVYSSDSPHQACRECLLLILHRVDPNFFDLLTNAEGKALVKRLILCKCECHEGGRWEGPWGCNKCRVDHRGWM